ncbi:MAG: phosphoglycerate dehydrogenase [Thermodesulfobacteriota bacterium]
MKILISDNLAPVGVEILEKAGFDVDVNTGLNPEELKSIISEYDGLVIRSASKVTRELIDAADNLKVIGRAGIGLDNVDVPVASQKGIVVMNAPDGNATTAAEHAISMMMALTRNIPQATSRMKEGGWDKKRFQGREVTGKKLGIVGIGRIGGIVANRAQGLHMKVLAYDPHMPEDVVDKMGIELISLDELCQRSDYISVHVPLTKETAKIISTNEFKLMKEEAMFVNCARGGVVDEEALYDALVNNDIRGAALDVFEKEPTSLETTPLLKLDNFICTPHLGASTAEAQENVASAIAEQMADYLLKGTINNAVNVPSVSSKVLSKVKPFVNLAQILGSFHMQITRGSVKEVSIDYIGKLAEMDTEPITVAFLKGFFTPILGDAVNFVNAPVLAKERDIKVTESKTKKADAFTSLLSVRVKTTKGDNTLAGTVFGKSEIRMVQFNSFRLELEPTGNMLFIISEDTPGIMGKIGTFLGAAGVNISTMVMGMRVENGAKNKNIVLLHTKPVIDKKLLKEIRELEMIDDAMVVTI